MYVLIYVLALPDGPLASKVVAQDTLSIIDGHDLDHKVPFTDAPRRQGSDMITISMFLVHYFLQTASISTGAKSGRQTIREHRTAWRATGPAKPLCAVTSGVFRAKPRFSLAVLTESRFPSLKFLPAHDAMHSNASNTTLTWI
ncbi:hypothetical protein BJ166DRAFT_243279 [Pestalotiopsis sp. NC0098]|nr:hypothetical protein BJ166DRAFT_243279 [Pestalotiopsis sp. NC0098]